MRGPRQALLIAIRSLVLPSTIALGLEGATAAAAPAPSAHVDKHDLDEAVCDDWRRAGKWNEAWAGIFVVAAVGSAGYAALAPGSWLDDEHRAGLYVTAAKASIGALAKLVDPLDIDVEGLCHDRSATSRSVLLTDAARRERRALIPNVLGGLALNTAGLLYLGYGRHAWESAWISFGIGSVVGVASTLTAPFQSWLLKRRLDHGHALAVAPLFGTGSGGVALVGTW